MRKFIFICAALALAGCADWSTGPDAARRQTSPRRLNDEELTCRSGYVIAYDELGNPYCAPVDGFGAPGDSTVVKWFDGSKKAAQ